MSNSTPNTNTSATGGYLQPSPSTSLPGGLTFEEFLQQVLVGVSSLPGDLVREAWQVNPPKQPDIYTDWLKFALTEDDADTFAYNSLDSNNNNVFMRMEALTVQCTFYGPKALHYAKLVRDGFQIGQNREVLQSAKMDFVSTSKATRAPDLVNERWVSRWEMSISLRREILRVYPILNVLSVNGTLYTLQSSGVKTIPINAGQKGN
jgi:hypothetical protein